MVESLGLETYKNDYGFPDGERHTSIHAIGYLGELNANVDMFGSDGDLSSVELAYIVVDNPEIYASQGSIVLAFLTLILPSWEDGPEWIIRALSRGKAAVANGKATTLVNGHQVAIARSFNGGMIFIAITAHGK